MIAQPNLLLHSILLAVALRALLLTHSITTGLVSGIGGKACTLGKSARGILKILTPASRYKCLASVRGSNRNRQRFDRCRIIARYIFESFQNACRGAHGVFCPAPICLSTCFSCAATLAAVRNEKLPIAPPRLPRRERNALPRYLHQDAPWAFQGVQRARRLRSLEDGCGRIFSTKPTFRESSHLW